MNKDYWESMRDYSSIRKTLERMETRIEPVSGKSRDDGSLNDCFDCTFGDCDSCLKENEI